MFLYGPLQKQRPSEHYMDATTDRFSIGNIGVEWLAPTAVLLVLAETIFWAFRVRLVHQAVFFATVLAWSFVMFSYLHDRMHVKNFWMERNPILKGWFRRGRQLHDIHHRMLNDGGLMDIAHYLNRSVRTVQRWEMLEAMPVHRHCHGTGGSVYAYKQEVDAWRSSRSQEKRPTLQISATRRVPTRPLARAEQSALLRL